MKYVLKESAIESPCCKAGWLWRQICGMRVTRRVRKWKHDRKRYDVKCSKCQLSFEIDGGRC